MTVVLPAPIIICFTLDPPPANVAMKFRTVATCFCRRSRFHTNSKIKKRGSNAWVPAC